MTNSSGPTPEERIARRQAQRAAQARMETTLKPGLYRVQEGAMFAGVCSGLEACGKGNTGTWRLGFAIGGFFFIIPIFAYIAMAVVIPQARTRKEVKDANAIAGEVNTYGLSAGQSTFGVEMELEKLSEMKRTGLIDEDEYKQLRKKALGL